MSQLEGIEKHNFLSSSCYNIILEKITTEIPEPIFTSFIASLQAGKPIIFILGVSCFIMNFQILRRTNIRKRTCSICNLIINILSIIANIHLIICLPVNSRSDLNNLHSILFTSQMYITKAQDENAPIYFLQIWKIIGRCILHWNIHVLMLMGNAEATAQVTGLNAPCRCQGWLKCKNRKHGGAKWRGCWSSPRISLKRVAKMQEQTRRGQVNKLQILTSNLTEKGS